MTRPRILPSMRLTGTAYENAIAAVLQALRENPNQSVNRLAQSLGLSRSTALRYARMAGWTPPRMTVTIDRSPEPETRRPIAGQCADCQCQTLTSDMVTNHDGITLRRAGTCRRDARVIEDLLADLGDAA